MARIVSARPITIAARATTIELTNLAAMNRVRDGSRVKVTMAVRWVHSLVIDMTPSRGSRMLIGMLAAAVKSPKDTVVSWARTTHSMMISTSAVTAPIEISSQRPARVSNILRRSTATSRLNGTRAVSPTSRVIGAVVAALVMGGLLSGRGRA